MIVRYDFRSEHEIVSFRFVAEDDCCSDVRGGNLSDTMAVDVDGRVAILIIIVYKFLDPFFFFFFTFLHFFFFLSFTLWVSAVVVDTAAAVKIYNTTLIE